MKEKIYVIHAYEGTYGGLHGIEDWIIEKTSLDIAKEIALDASYGVINSYSSIYEGFENDAEEEDLIPGTEDFIEYVQELMDEDIAYTIYEVIRTKGKTVKELDSILSKDPESFIKEYCKIAIE